MEDERARRWSGMRYWAGFDVGKRFHWMCVLDDEGKVVLSRRVEATEEDLEAACSQIRALGDAEDRTIAVDLVGGPATLLEAVLLGRGERVFYLPGVSVNRARDGYRGEQKSDRGDARVIADQLRMRWRSLKELRPRDDEAAEMRLLVSHRRDLVADQARIITAFGRCSARCSPASTPCWTSTRTGHSCCSAGSPRRRPPGGSGRPAWPAG